MNDDTLGAVLQARFERCASRVAASRIGRPGFTCAPAQAARVDARDGNRSYVEPDEGCEIRIAPGSSDNLVSVGHVEIARAVVDIRGDGNTVVVGGGRKFQGRIGIVGDRNVFFFGRDATCNRGNFVITGNDLAIVFGDDCMLSFDISVRAGDSHGVFDVATLTALSEPADILVEPHVWLGEGATVLKGSHIGAGCVVGASAVVNAAHPGMSVLAGTPAKVIRSGVSWTRQLAPPQAERQRVRALLQAFLG